MTTALAEWCLEHAPRHHERDAEWAELAWGRILEAELQVKLAASHPAFLSAFVTCVDSRSGERFEYQMLTEEESALLGVEHRGWKSSLGKDWSWQRGYLEWTLENDQTITLKGRQLGVTWVWGLRCLHVGLFRPGADVLVYSIGENEAAEVINRIWDMWLSLPEHFKERVKVLTPSRGGRPSEKIVFEHPDGRVSSIEAMPATKSAGHSRSAALILFDEGSRIERARELWKAVVPATGDKGGVIGVVSTANGMSDGKGQGNFFHALWKGAGKVNYPKLKTKFLGWWLHPERDQQWYDTVSLDADSDKAEQYPNDPDEAFLLSGSPYFAKLALRHYHELQVQPLYQMLWELDPDRPSLARRLKGEGLPIEVYEEPVKGHKYAIGADVATGSGQDFSVGAVIDLMTGKPVAELYMQGDYKRFATQLHYLGLWYNGARIAVEIGGGYGDTVIAYLRDGLDGRKPYPKMYRHVPTDSAKRPMSTKFGFPMNQKTRPKVVSELRRWVNDLLLDYVTPGFYSEAMTFVHRDTNPSPRHADGCNDDRVMAWGVALEMYARYGEHEHDRRHEARKKLAGKKSSSTHDTPWSYE